MSSSERKYDYLTNPGQENVVVQIQDKNDEPWMDYCRCTIGEARVFMRKAGTMPYLPNYRLVDWIWKDVIES